MYAIRSYYVDEAIANLAPVSASAVISNDLFFNGKSTSWIKVAYTLKARYYMETREYQKAYDAALLGISSTSLSWKFIPPATVPDGDFNLLNTFVDQRGGYMSTTGAYLHDNLLKAGQTGNRNNAKTNEDARLKYVITSYSIHYTKLYDPRK